MNKPTSIYLDLIRFLAALTVFIVHANYDRFTGGLPFFRHVAGLGNDAVMVFFVLSGFVIAYVTSEKENTLRDYFASRFARLYSVAVPALVLTVALDWVGSQVNSSLYAGWWFQADYPVWRFVCNLFFVNELLVQLDSAVLEWPLLVTWLRILVLCALRLCLLPAGGTSVSPGRARLPSHRAQDSSAAANLAHGGIGFLGRQAPHYLLYHRVGAVRHLNIGLSSLSSRWVPHVLLKWTHKSLGEPTVEMLGWSKYFLSSYLIGALIMVHFIGIAAISRHVSAMLVACESPVRYLAGFTFALYLFHYPCLQFFAAVFSKIEHPGLRTSLVLGGTILVVWTLGTITEKRKHNLKMWFLRLFDTASKRVLPAGKGNLHRAG